MKKSVLLLIITGILFSCKEPVPMNLSEKAIIPLPVELIATNSSFELNEKTNIYIIGQDAGLIRNGYFLSETLSPSTGFELPVKAAPSKIKSGNIVLSLSSATDFKNDEAYQLDITPKQIQLVAKTAEGIFRGIQTLRQIFPAKVELKTVQPGPWLVASGTIADYPEYEYRGTMLDVSRHFFALGDVKKYIDHLAYYKVNKLHLHLADDQGWRIEIKSWPNLTAIGGSTEVGGGEGGFYTQEEYKEIVAYAQKRFITVIPEIDMPGHTNAALASYPELNCNGIATQLYTGTKVGFSTLCTDKEITYKFVDDVVRELAELTPGPYIHLGGDESHVTPLKDYIPFINRIQKIVLSHGKQMIGWDEIGHASLDSSSIIQFWANEKNTKMGIAQGAKVIVAPAKRAYLDMKYHKETKLGLDWAALIEVDEGYNWDPASYAEGITRENILGVEAPLWSETVQTLDDIEFLVFPRLAGHAEIGWTPVDQREWESYKLRLAKHGKRFDALGINYYPSELVPWEK